MVLVPSFSDDFRVTVFEHRGYGRTNNPAGSMTFAQIADDVAELVDQLGLGSAHIAGISDGGVVALDCALRAEMTCTVTTGGANYCVHDGIQDFSGDTPEVRSSSPFHELVRTYQGPRKASPIQ